MDGEQPSVKDLGILGNEKFDMTHQSALTVHKNSLVLVLDWSHSGGSSR